MTDDTEQERDALERAFDEALARCTEQQATFVRHLITSGDPKAAAVEAGYKQAGSAVARVRNLPHVREAVSAGVALREHSDDFTRDDAVKFLERILFTRLSDVCVLNAQGVPVAVRDPETLSPAQSRAVKKLHARVHRSAGGERAHVTNLDLEFWDPRSTLELIAKLRGWTADSPLVEFNLNDLGSDAARPQGYGALHELGDLVIADRDLERFLDAGDDERRAMLKEAIAELRSLRAIPAAVER